VRAGRPAAVLAALALALGGGAGAAAARTPRVDYMLECQGCHRADGSGFPGRVPDLRDRIGRFPQVPGGRAYLVGVPGSASSPLSDAELAAVLNWMIQRFAPERAPAVAPYTAEEVARHRRPLADVESVRRELLRALAATGGSRP